MTAYSRVEVGDHIRMGVGLIKRIQEMGNFSLVVELVDVRVEEDGTKTLIVKALNDGSNFNPVTNA